MTSQTAVRASSVAAALILAGCASDTTVSRYVPQIVTPYRIDIQQGNFITQDLVDKLAVGLTRDQVRFLLGTPLLTDVFHANRWDYVFRFSKGRNEPERRHLAIFFDSADRVARWETDMVAPAPAAGAAPGPAPAGGAAPVQAPVEARPAVAPAAAAPQAAIEAAVAAVIPPPAAPAVSTPVAVVQAVAETPAPTVAAMTPPAPAAAPAPVALQAPVAPESAPPAAASVANAAAPAARAESAPVAAVKQINADASPAAVLSVIESWRAAWSSRDVARYLSLYAADFAPPGGLSRAKWEAQRRERLKRASFIVLKVVEPQVTITGENQAAASFTQVYESDTLKESGRKVLALVQQGGKWLIRGESFEK